MKDILEYFVLSLCFLKVQWVDTTWSVPCMTPDPCDERRGLSKSALWQDLRVSCSLLVEPDEITFVCSTVFCLFDFCLETLKKKKGEIETNAKQKDRKEVLS